MIMYWNVYIKLQSKRLVVTELSEKSTSSSLP